MASFKQRFAFFTKTCVANGSDFVHQVVVEFERHAQPKPETRFHARGIGLHRHVKILSKLGEFLNERDFLADFFFRRVKPRHKFHIFTPGQAALKTPCQPDRPGDRGAGDDSPAVRVIRPANHAQQRRFPRPVTPYQRHALAGRQRQREILKDIMSPCGRAVRFGEIFDSNHDVSIASS